MIKKMKRAIRERLTSMLASVGEHLYTTRRKVATGAAALLTLSLGYHVIFGQNGISVYEEKRHESHELDTQLKQLQQQNEELREHTAHLQKDPNAIEHEAREDLHYTRPGEVIYTMPQQTPAPQKPTTDAAKK